MKPESQICSICGNPYEGYGHNAQPVNDGRCCGTCNAKAVIPRRLYDLYRSPVFSPKKLREDSK